MHLLFDLDGTLTDSAAGITRCIAHALERLGRVPPPAAALRPCIGAPLAEAFRALLGGADDSLVRHAVALYRERFASVGMYENEVCAGIPELLATLRERGLPLRVVTSKPTVYSVEIVRHFGLADFFEGVHGSELDGTRTDKTELVAHVLEIEKIAPHEAIMIGDRSHDVRGALANDVRPIGVLWGYGSREELAAAGAAAIVARPADLPDALGADG